MERQPESTPIPKRSCMITLMFPVSDDSEALSVKQKIDDALKDIEDKRYTFQINER